MSDPLSTASQPSTHYSGVSQQLSLMRISGGLSFAGCMVGLAILILGCAGFDAALAFSIVPIGLGIAGSSLVATTLWWGDKNTAESTTLASLFVAALAIAGGVVEAAAWFHWPLLFNQRG